MGLLYVWDPEQPLWSQAHEVGPGHGITYGSLNVHVGNSKLSLSWAAGPTGLGEHLHGRLRGRKRKGEKSDQPEIQSLTSETLQDPGEADRCQPLKNRFSEQQDMG